MLLINRISTAPYQRQTLVIDDGSSFTMTMYYRPMQFGWFFENITYGDTFVINGLRISNSPNMLYQWKNKIPFGIGCFSSGNREPTQQEDFFSGASKLYILTEDEVEEYAAFIRAG